MAQRSDERRIAHVPPEGAGKRLDRFLAESFERYSRRKLAEVIRSGAVRVNGRPAKPGTVLTAGDELELPQLGAAVAAVDERIREKDRLRQQALPPDAVVELHRDDDLLIVAKPPGVPVHGGAELRGVATLVDLLREDVLAGFGLVHRLDRDTSGAIALVRGKELRAAASRMFAESSDRVGKLYEAIVEGVPSPDAAEIALPLTTPDPHGRAHVDEVEGRPARTRYATLEQFVDASRLRLELLTGRTHQIRAHLAAIGHPLLVDPRYGTRGGWKLTDPRGRLDARLRRTPLHAAELRMPHPRTGEAIEVRAPLPGDMKYALEVLRVAHGGKRKG